MVVSIAEYLGQRTDTTQVINPEAILPESERHNSPNCPFNGTACSKMRMRRNPKPPICSLRRSDGQFYIVCEHRLISTKVENMTHYQQEMLLDAARALFNQNIQAHQIGYKAEVSIQTGTSRHSADFILAITDPQLETYGPSRLLVEVQGGGETNNTGQITRHVEAWLENPTHNNQQLQQNISGAGTIQTNAWRRLQEQLFAKATTAQKTNPEYSFAVLMGEVVFDYICTMMPELPEIGLAKEDNWNTAFIVYSETPTQNVGNLTPVELHINHEKSLFLHLSDIFTLMTQRGGNDPNAFSGSFRTLDGQSIELD